MIFTLFLKLLLISLFFFFFGHAVFWAHQGNEVSKTIVLFGVQPVQYSKG